MTVEALWIIEPQITDAERAHLQGMTASGQVPPFILRGIAVLETGRILGGDHGSTWVGDFNASDIPRLDFKVHVNYWDPGVIPLLDPTRREMDMIGTAQISADGKNGRGTYHVADKPHLQRDFVMVRVAELP